MTDDGSGSAADTPLLTEKVNTVFEKHAEIFDSLLTDINAHVLGGGGADEGAATTAATAAQQRTALIDRISPTSDQYAQIYIKIGMIAILKNAGESMRNFKTQLESTVSEMQKALDPDAAE